MKNGLIMAGGLLVSFVLFLGTMTVVSLAMRYSVQDTVLTFTTPTETRPPEKLSFPYAIPETTMMAENLVNYEGPLLDENNDAPIVNGLALKLRNTGEKEILSAGIIMKLGDHTYRFSGSHIPAGESILLPALEDALWTDEPCTECTGWAIYLENPGLTETDVEILETGMDLISVTNQTERVLRDVRLYYKNYLPEGDVYLGTPTHTAWVGTIQPGQTVTLELDRYAQGYSKIVRIEGESE